MMRVKACCGLVLIFFLGTVLPLRAAETGRPLMVGMELAYPPFEMTDAQGKPAGISVDMARALGERLGRPVLIRNIAFDGLIPALKTGKVDLVISSMTATAERAQAIDFSDPYLATGLCLLLNKASSARGIDDLDRPGVRVAVKRGTTGHLYASQRLKKAELLVLDKESAAVLEVAQGKAEAFIYDQMSTYQNWRRHKATTRAVLEPFQKEAWAVGLRQGDEEMKRQVNEFIREYRARGGFEQLGERYLKEMKDEFKRLGYAFFL